ncbi:MAG: hypothetical protein ACC628_23335 [Pirellulaceae bacterium]
MLFHPVEVNTHIRYTQDTVDGEYADSLLGQKMKYRPFVIPVMLLGMVAPSGCGPTQSEVIEATDASLVERDTGAAQSQMSAESTSQPAPTERQLQAIEAITSAGGRVERDANRLPVLIDLASERVFADDDTVRAVLAFPELKKLRLAVSTVAPETIGELTSLTQLNELLLQDASIEDGALEELLHAMPALQRLTLRRLSKITDAGVAAVAACAELEVLALIEMNQVTGATLDQLQNIERLRSLDLRNCGQLSAADFEKLISLDRLEDLKIGGPIANDEVLSTVARLPSITSLTVEDGEVTGEGLQQLARARALAGRLRSLSFARCFGVTDAALVVLGDFPKLETVALRDLMITGSFLKTLRESARSPLRLKTLVVTRAFLTDETVADLPEVAPNLVRLDLRGNLGITDASLDGFERLQALESLRLEETGVVGQVIATERPEK